MYQSRRKKDISPVLVFLGPSALGLLVFYLIPFVGMLIYSFFDSPVDGKFAGLQNYIELINSGSYRLAVHNTAVFSFISVPLLIFLSLLLSLLLNKKIAFQHELRTVFIVPLVVPVASVILIFELLFDGRGFINGILSIFGITPVNWMDSQWAMVVVVMIYIWKNLGYNMVLFLAGLKDIPREYYEAASLDGAGSTVQFFNITLVYLMPTLFFVIIISVVNSFKVFREVYLLAGDYPHQSIYMLQHYMNNMFSKLDYHKLVTAAVLMAAVICLLVFALFKIQKRVNAAIED